MRWLIGVVALTLAATPARADDRSMNPFLLSPDNYFVETHYELGFQSVSGLTFGGGSASGYGIHLNEHNGILSRIHYIGFLFLAAFQGGGDVRLKGSYTETPTEEYRDVKNSRGQVVDRVKIVGTRRTLSATVVPLTEEEKRLRDENFGRMAFGIATLAQMPSHFDLTYFPQRDNGQLRGLRGALYGVALSFSKYGEIAMGYAGAHLKAEVMDAETGAMRTIKHRSRALAFRVGVAPARFLVLTAELHANLLDLDDSDGRYGSTVRATAALSIPYVERLFAKVGTERIGLGANGTWSTFFEGGLRF